MNEKFYMIRVYVQYMAKDWVVVMPALIEKERTGHTVYRHVKHNGFHYLERYFQDRKKAEAWAWGFYKKYVKVPSEEKQLNLFNGADNA